MKGKSPDRAKLKTVAVMLVVVLLVPSRRVLAAHARSDGDAAFTRGVGPTSSSSEVAFLGTQGAGHGTEAIPWAPPEPGYRIQVRQEGIYKLGYAELAAAGVPVDALDPTSLQVFNQGSEVAIWVEGEGDHSFGAADYVLFLGQALESKYTWHNVYWLTYGHVTGKRMVVRDGTPSGAVVPAWQVDRLHLESNTSYLSSLPGSEDLDRFLWAYVNPPYHWSWSYSFALGAPYTDAGGVLEVSLYGYNSTLLPRAQVYLNDTLLDDATWSGGTWYLSTASFPAHLLVAGNNTLRIDCPNSGDLVYVDWAELQYANTFVAAGDVQGFAYDTPGSWQYTITGFSGADVVVLDVTDGAAPQRITGADVVPGGGDYTVAFEDDIVGATRYRVTGPAGFLPAVSIQKDTASNLRSTANGADYIVITHADFRQAVQPLAAYRASLGLRVIQVDVQDVYDEFGYGIVGAHPIHDFLDYAYHNWQLPRPKYVLLVGDGHYDPKNYLGYGRTSYVPPYLAPVDPWIVETAADNRYVTVDGDDAFPDMIIGRLPVNSVAETQTMVAKTLQYEQNPTPGDWRKRILFVADNADAGGDFAALSDGMIACCLPAGYTASKIYYLVTHQTAPEVRTAIIDAINQGRLIVNYIGHASTSAWAAEALFSTIDIGSLANATMQPIMLTMTCRDGYFINPTVSSGHSMAESLVRASGKGAVAAWSPSGLGVSTGHDYLDRGFFQALFDGSGKTVGEATLAGKQLLWSAHHALDLLDTYHLFGDPALRVFINPTGVTLASLGVVPGDGESLVVQWETVSEIDNLGFNVFRAEPDGGPLVKLNANLIPSQVPPGSPIGALYEFEDQPVVPGVPYYYWVADVDVYGESTLHGPVRATLGRLYLPAVSR